MKEHGLHSEPGAMERGADVISGTEDVVDAAVEPAHNTCQSKDSSAK